MFHLTEMVTVEVVKIQILVVSKVESIEVPKGLDVRNRGVKHDFKFLD